MYMLKNISSVSKFTVYLLFKFNVGKNELKFNVGKNELKNKGVNLACALDKHPLYMLNLFFSSAKPHGSLHSVQFAWASSLF